MRSNAIPPGLTKGLPGLLVPALLVLLAGCTVAKPRSDDPWEGFNRKMYAFNDAADKAVIRPVAAGYRKITSANVRRVVSNFYDNIKTPITIANDVLQGDPRRAARNTGRFLVNTTLGFAGLFDPASEMDLPLDETDFGVTLAKWGVPDGPYLVLPFVGSTTVRDFWRLPVDQYFDPLSWYADEHDFRYHTEYLPNIFYLVTLRARGIEAEGLLEGVYDPYVFYRDAYRQRRLYEIFDGQPPEEYIEQMQGANEEDIDKLLEEQHQYEQQKQQQPKDQPQPRHG
ncbi:MAG TPA: VacJ family lipoprotein [Rhodanobacteraceae bacterium]|nr:VacJ family lipoprotein [Rhodanobacteraceae bacterium]